MISSFILSVPRNVCKSALWVLEIRSRNITPVFISNYSTFSIQHFMNGNSSETGSLFLRFAKYLAMERCKFDTSCPTTIRYSDFFPIDNKFSICKELRKLPINQFPPLIIFTFTYKTNGDPVKYVKVINEIDTVMAQRNSEMDYDTVLRTLNALLYLLPEKICETHFYRSAVERLVEEFESNFPVQKFVQVCFFLGLNKKRRLLDTTKMLKKLLDRHLTQYVSELSMFDLALVSNAFYKASIVVKDVNFLKKIEDEVVKSTLCDDALLITFVKSLRLNRVKSQEVCARLSKMCSFEKLNMLRIEGLAHIFAYYADNLWDEPEICERIVTEMLSRLQQKTNGHIRSKDLAMFLWCCAQLNKRDLFQQSALELIEELIITKFENNEYKSYPDHFIDSCLSLWILGLRSQKLIQHVLNMKTIFLQMKSDTERSKLDTRHEVLLSAVEIERLQWVAMMKNKEKAFDVQRVCPEFLLKNREIYEVILKMLKQQKNVTSANIICPIKGFNIPNIQVHTADNSKYLIEIIDKDELLHFSGELPALIQLKVRLLKHLAWNVVLIRWDKRTFTEEINLKELLPSAEFPVL